LIKLIKNFEKTGQFGFSFISLKLKKSNQTQTKKTKPNRKKPEKIEPNWFEPVLS
jgi:hypothetical protein